MSETCCVRLETETEGNVRNYSSMNWKMKHLFLKGTERKKPCRKAGREGCDSTVDKRQRWDQGSLQPSQDVPSSSQTHTASVRDLGLQNMLMVSMFAYARILNVQFLK